MKAPRPARTKRSRAEQLRAAKRAQRRREREAGLVAVELKLPAAQARRLREAAALPGFQQALVEMLDETVLDLDAWPVLRELAWSGERRLIPARDALALYERNWRHVDVAAMGPEERALLARLVQRHGGGVFDG